MPNPLPRRREAILLVGIVLLALGVRLLYWQDAGSMSLVQVPTGDAATYVALSQELRTHGPLAPEGLPYQQAPLYPLFLWALGNLGFDLGGVRAVQFLLGAIGVGLLAWLGRRLAGGIGFAVAGIGGALYGPFIFYESDLLSISLAILLVEIGLLAWGSPRGAAVAGLCLGSAALAQPNFLIAGLVAVALSWIAPRAMGWKHTGAVALLTAGLLAPPALTLARNLAVCGEPILISANGGINFFIGNNPTADGSFHLPPDSGLLNRPEGLFQSAREVAEGAQGRSLSHAQVDRYWWLRGVDYWLTDTGRAFGVTLGKVLLAMNNAEIPSHYDYEFFKGEVGILQILPTFGLVLALGGVGLGLAWRRRKDPLVLLFLAFLLSIIPFFITGRYRLPLAVFLWPAAGVAIRELWEARRQPRVLVPVGFGVLAYLVVAFFPLYASGTTRAHMLNLEASTRVQQGNLDDAERLLQDALAIAPNHPEALNNLAYVAELRGDTARALQLYEQAIAADPGQAETYLNVEDLHRKAKRPADALLMLDRLERARGGRMDDVAAAVAYRRGINTLSLGDTLTARTYLEDAVAKDPRLTGGWLTLSMLYRVMDLPEDALAASARAVELAPDSPEALVTHGRSLEVVGNREEAIQSLVRAIELGGPNPDISFRIGELHLALNRPQEAETYFKAANAGRPHPESLLELGKLYESQKRWTLAKATYRKLLRAPAPYSDRARDRLIVLGVIKPNATP